MLRRLGVLLVAASLLVAVPAVAKTFHGVRTLTNPTHSTRMPATRVKRASKIVIRKVFAVRKGTEIYFCGHHAPGYGTCDVAFTSKFGRFSCGNTAVRAHRTKIVVRYRIDNRGCADF